MYLSNNCLAEVYCQDAYAPDYHDVIAEAFCRAIETYDPPKGDFKTWVGIQRSGVVREDQRLRQRVGYLEEVYAANEEKCLEILRREESCGFVPDEPEHRADVFFTSPEAIFNALLRKERRKIIEDLLSSVSRRSRIIITERFFNGKKLGEIAEKLQITDSTVERDEKKTLHIFRELLAEKNIILDDLIS